MLLLTAVVWSLPDSALRREAVPAIEPLALTAGLDQGWSMFAPDPYRRLETVEVHLQTADGEQRVWAFPTGGVVDQFTWYRWHKLKETAVEEPGIREDIVRWAAGEVLEPSDYPARASMLLVAEGFTPPGGDEPVEPDVTEVLYAETLTGPP